MFFIVLPHWFQLSPLLHTSERTHFYLAEGALRRPDGDRRRSFGVIPSSAPQRITDAVAAD
jgi:hypothetical protein